jgi:hypothetical protein
LEIEIFTGSQPQANEYYRDVVTKDTGFPTDNGPSLNLLLQYFGYPALRAEDLEKKDSVAIMNDFPGGEVLVVRYFAPKITDVSGKTNQGYGWRKLVRLKALDGSKAAQHKIKSMYLLFNIFSNDLKEPFGKDGTVNHSVNNQVMLVPEPGQLPRTAYWMTFGAFDSNNADEQGKLITYMYATFDAASPSITSQRYFVPGACSVCHGGVKTPLLNYLDTDHWFDRIHRDDFDVVGKKQAVLFDAGTNDADDPKFKQTFRVFRQLNEEIHDQNKAVDPERKKYQSLAGKAWLDGHCNSAGQLTLFQRGITATGSAKWCREDPVDRKLLPLLNRYCYRCHSSVKYHIYDKSAVLDRSESMIAKINLAPCNPEKSMPQDRQLPPAVRVKLSKLLAKVHLDITPDDTSRFHFTDVRFDSIEEKNGGAYYTVTVKPGFGLKDSKVFDSKTFDVDGSSDIQIGGNPAAPKDIADLVDKGALISAEVSGKTGKGLILRSDPAGPIQWDDITNYVDDPYVTSHFDGSAAVVTVLSGPKHDVPQTFRVDSTAKVITIHNKTHAPNEIPTLLKTGDLVTAELDDGVCTSFTVK